MGGENIDNISEEIDLLSLELQLGKTAFFGSLTSLGAIVSLITFRPSSSFGELMTGIVIILLTFLFFILFYVGFNYIVYVESKIGHLRSRILENK